LSGLAFVAASIAAGVPSRRQEPGADDDGKGTCDRRSTKREADGIGTEGEGHQGCHEQPRHDNEREDHGASKPCHARMMGQTPRSRSAAAHPQRDTRRPPREPA